MSMDLVLKPSCGGCGSSVELYGSVCKHLTLCVNCGKTMAEKQAKCYECGCPITRLIREYNVRASTSSEMPSLPITEHEIRTVLMQENHVTPRDLVDRFKSRLRSCETRGAFAVKMRKIAKVQQKSNGAKFVVLREMYKDKMQANTVTTMDLVDRFKSRLKLNEDKDTFGYQDLVARFKSRLRLNENMKSVNEPGSSSKGSVVTKVPPQASSSRNGSALPSKSGSLPPTGPFTEDEIRAVLTQKKPVTTRDIVARFKSRLKSRLRTKDDKDAIAAILCTISKIQKSNGANFVVLREK